MVKIGIVSNFENFDDSSDLASGGGTHITIMAKKWKDTGEDIRFFGRKTEFSLWSNFVGSLKILFGKSIGDNRADFDFLLAASPYPLDFIYFLKITGKKYRRGSVYFHHLPPPPWWKPLRRGFMISLLNYFYFHTVLIVCKILGIAIFLGNPDGYRIGRTILLKAEEAVTGKEPIHCSEGKDVDIFFIGRIQKSKGVIDLVRALYILKTKGYNLKTVVAGPFSDRRYYSKIRRFILRKKIENIEFLGKISEDKKINCFCRSRIFVFPSYVEGWSLSVMEAAFYQLPIVAYNLSAYSYLENNFVKVVPGRINDLAGAIEWAITNCESATEMAHRAKRLVEKYNYDGIARYQLGIFSSMLKE
jgi:glycosyltransferase involved in cell wall biosynthesis